jgi:MOB kinase activator 1
MFMFGSSSKRGGGSSNKSEDTNPAKTSNNNVLSKKSSFLSASSAGAAAAQSSGNIAATGNTSHQTSNIQSTFRKKPIPVGQKGIELQAHINSTLGNNGSLRDAVKLPKGEDELEWIAVNVVDFFNALVFLYDVVNTEHCTEKTCPTMCAGPKFEYRWMDGEEVMKPMECSAPVYCGYLFRWVEKQIDDEKIFPKKQGDAFPRDFKKRVKKIAARLFRVYAHLYHSHFKIICALQAEKHLNTIFKHFVYFAVEFSLISSEEMMPLRELVDGVLQAP